MRRVIYDIEANGFNPDRIWCVVAKDVDTDEVFTFFEDDRDSFKEFTNEVSQFIGHNIIQYDNYWLKQLWNIEIPLRKSLDTLLLSRLFNPCWEVRMITPSGKSVTKVKQRRGKNEHSLESWGKKLKFPKGDFNDFSQFSQEMLDYCIQDVHLNHRVYLELREESQGFSKESIRLEHSLQDIISRQERNGFLIDIPAAKSLLRHCEARCRELEHAMQKDFPPLPVYVKTYTPRLNKDGTHNMSSMGPMKEQYGFQYGGEPYSLIKWEPFNLGSPSQVVRRLKGHWDPVDFTSKDQPRMSDRNIRTIRKSAPESIKNIKLYRMYSSRCNEIRQWITGSEESPDGRLHGRVTHLGSWTGRASHTNPNTANITRVSHDRETKEIIYGEEGSYGWECRSLWTVPNDRVLLGCDASGIQLRILAHYINNEKFTESIISEQPNDIHTVNSRILGCDRDTAKTFIYSWLLGAGVVKTSEILGCTTREAVRVRERFVKLTPGLEELLRVKSLYAERGWYYGLDKRKVYLPSDHLALTAFLQNGEHVIMSLANVYWDRWATERGIDYKQVGWIHDEWQTECDPKRAEELGYLQMESFRVAGEYLKLNCPLTGSFNIGKTWAETH